MPKIREYEASNVKLNPSNLGETAIDQAARRLSTYTSQAASGAREIGQLQEKSLVEEGKQIEAFLRYTGLSEEGSGVAIKGGGGKVDRSLIGTGANSGITRNTPDPLDFEGQGELLRGARGISRLADNKVSNATPLADLPNPKHEKETYDKYTPKTYDPTSPAAGTGQYPTNPDTGMPYQENQRSPDGSEIWAPPGSWSPSVGPGQDNPSTTPTPDLNTGGMDSPYPGITGPSATPDTSAPAAPSTDQPSLFSDVASDIGTWMMSTP